MGCGVVLVDENFGFVLVHVWLSVKGELVLHEVVDQAEALADRVSAGLGRLGDRALDGVGYGQSGRGFRVFDRV